MFDPAGPRPIAIGCMRLSTNRDRDDERAIEVLHAAFDAGVTLLDTADAYCWDQQDAGHNERLIARARSTWTGDRARIRVATKGGLTRPHGNWIPDGRGRHLTSACEASLRALGVQRLDLYQLHAPDPRTPFSTSVRALDGLKRDGLIERVGLCNVTVGQIEEARRITDVCAVQVELSLWHDQNVHSGVVEHCLANAIPVLAYRPLGGWPRRKRIQSDRLLAEIAAEHHATPHEIALAWLAGLSPLVVPLPGPTQVATARSAARAMSLELTSVDRDRLTDALAAPQAIRARAVSRQAAAAPRTDAEVVLIMGLPGAGKSTLAATFVARGYVRLNRDEAGGTLLGLLPALDALLASGATRVVIDNTYVSRKSRAPVIATAAAHSIPVRCVWLSTSVEDAQVNAAARIVSRYDRLLMPEEMRQIVKRDVSAFAPGVQFRYQRDLEPPDASEGFSRIENRPFERTRDAAFTARALLLWCDDVVWRSRSGARTPACAEDVDILPNRPATLAKYHAEGWRLLGLSWQPGIAEKTMTVEQVEAAFGRMRELLGVDVEVAYCPHAAGPPICWCRKPLPGLGVMLVHRHRLDPAQCVYVGAGSQDPGFARRLGFQYCDADTFFA